MQANDDDGAEEYKIRPSLELTTTISFDPTDENFVFGKDFH